MKLISLIATFIFIQTFFAQNSANKISSRKAEKLIQKYRSEGQFDFANYSSVFPIRDSIKEEFISFSVNYVRGDTLVLNISEYKPRKRRKEIAEIYFNSIYCEKYKCMMIIFGYSFTIWEDGKLKQKSFTPKWAYTRKNNN